MPTSSWQDDPPNAGLFKLVYRSHVTNPSDISRRERDIAAILDASQTWNSANDITGALLLSPTGYAQVLEGPPHAVKSLFGHIVCDRRHQDVELLYCEPHTERDFGNWSMAVVGPPDETDIELASTAHQRDLVLEGGAEDIRLMLHWLLIDGPLRKRHR